MLTYCSQRFSGWLCPAAVIPPGGVWRCLLIGSASISRCSTWHCVGWAVWGSCQSRWQTKRHWFSGRPDSVEIVVQRSKSSPSTTILSIGRPSFSQQVWQITKIFVHKLPIITFLISNGFRLACQFVIDARGLEVWLRWHSLPLWLLQQAHSHSRPTSWLTVHSQTTISFRHTCQLGRHSLEMS